MLNLRKATLDDLDYLVMTDLLSDGETYPPTGMSPEERQEHWNKIAGFIQDEERKAAWVFEDTKQNRPIGMILYRWRTRDPQEGEAYFGPSVFDELAEDLFPPDGRFCEIFQLWVDPAFRRRGLGTRLKEEAEADCRRRGVGMIYTHTEERNLHVIELNRRLGYQEVRRGPIWDEMIRVSLVKRLDAETSTPLYNPIDP